MNELKVLELRTFMMGTSIKQDENGKWSFRVEYYPEGKKDPTVVYDALVINSSLLFDEYEYAIESAYDVMESFGMNVRKPVEIPVQVYNPITKDYKEHFVTYDGEIFLSKLIEVK